MRSVHQPEQGSHEPKPGPAPLAQSWMDWSWGLTLLGWGGRHAALFFSAPILSRWALVVHTALLILCALVGVLIIAREPARQETSLSGLAVALPTLILGGLVTRSVSPRSWDALSGALVVGGVFLSAWAFLNLGKSFAILPARRTTIFTGPYRVVRHPAYGGELIILGGCVLAEKSTLLIALWLLTLGLLLPRIAAEERLLLKCPHYRRYARSTRYRLLPGVY